MSSREGTSGVSQQEKFIGHVLHDGEYQIERVLGYGGMGRVYLAMHTSLSIPFALKQAQADQPLPESVIAELDILVHSSDPSQHEMEGQIKESDFPSSGGPHTDRFLREALLLARLQHPAMPTLYDYFFEGGYWYLVMDYIPGTTLSSYLRQHAPLPPLEALNYAMQLCDVLDYLHSQTPPIVFRDLKPSNVILTPTGSLMVVDFGIARYFKAGQISDTTDFGSPGYASPEQYQGEGQTDGRSDLYSLGVILHEMVSGQHPIGRGGMPISPQHFNPGISSVLSGLVTLATRIEPMYRFQSAYAFYQALERTYAIEERRAYRDHILHAIEPSSPGSQSEIPQDTDSPEQSTTSAQPDTANAERATPVLPSTLPLSMERRERTRIALRQARRARLEQDNLEIQMASVDESLKRRSFVPLSQTSLPLAESSHSHQEKAQTARNAQYTLRISLILVLVLFVVIASSFSYIRFFGPVTTSLPGGQPKGITPTHTTQLRGAWQVLPSLPSPEADNTATYVQVNGRSYIYMTGGYRGVNYAIPYDRTLYRYDIAAAHWEAVATSPFPGTVNNAATVDEHGQIFFTAGYSSDTYSVPSLLYMYQPANGVLTKISPPAQVQLGFGGTMIADQRGHLYILEGFMQGGNPTAKAGTGWYRYDIATGQWHILAALPEALGYEVLAPDGNNGILLLGGAADAGQHVQSNRTYRYNIAQNSWLQTPGFLPQPISGAEYCQVRPEQMIVLGGFNTASNMAQDHAWLVDLHTTHWTSLPVLPFGGSVLGAAACDNAGHVYMIRGANDPRHPTMDFWQLTLS